MDGSQWCTGCMAGHMDGTPNSHTCDEAQEIIDAINDEQAAIIVMVESRLLHDAPIEVKKYKAIIEKVELESIKYNQMRKEIIDDFALKTQRQKELEVLRKTAVDTEAAIEDHANRLARLQQKITDKLNQVRELSDVAAVNADYIEAKKDQFILEKLKQGGVDNWEWYDESLPSDEDIESFEYSLITRK